MTAETHRPFSSWLIWCYRKSISPAWKKKKTYSTWFYGLQRWSCLLVLEGF